jgi:hypothetical protein
MSTLGTGGEEMKRFFAIAMLLAATPAFAQTSRPIAPTDDARSHASDEEVRVARRAYRAECQKHKSVEYCECMTGGMAQSLAPADLGIAARFFAVDTTTAPPVAGAPPSSLQAAATTHAQFDRACRGSGR